MAITQRAAGTWAIVTANAAVAIPAGSTTGDRMYVLAAWKAFGTTASVAGWTEVTEFADGVIAAGANVGSVKVGAWYKDHSGSESNPTLAFSVAPAPAAVVMVTFQKGGSETWDAPAFATAAIAAAINWTATGSSNPGITAGDLVIELVGFRDDSSTMTRSGTTALAATGITWSANYAEFPATHASSTTSNDISADAGYRIASSGTASAAPTGTGTLLASETGTALWIRQRVSAGPVTVTPTLLGGYTQFSPTVQPGGVSISPALLGASSLFDPAVNLTLAVPLIGPSGVVFQPSPFQFILFFVPIIASGVAHEPTIHKTLVLGLVGSPSTLFDPSVSAPAVHPAVLGGYTLFTPASLSIQSDPQTLALPVISGTGAFDPEAFDPGSFGTSQVFSPTVTGSVTVQPSVLGGGAVFDMALMTGLVVYPGLVMAGSAFDPEGFDPGGFGGSGGVVFAPTATVTGIQVYPDLLGGYVLYAPASGAGSVVIQPALLGASSLFDPVVAAGGLTVSPVLLGQALVLYEPSLSVGGTTIESPFTVGGGVVFSPQVNFAGFAPPLISQLGAIFPPSITGGTITIAGYAPIAFATNLRPSGGAEHQRPVAVASHPKPESS